MDEPLEADVDNEEEVLLDGKGHHDLFISRNYLYICIYFYFKCHSIYEDDLQKGLRTITSFEINALVILYSRSFVNFKQFMLGLNIKYQMLPFERY